MYYIGIDGGGTNSRLIGVNESGELIGSSFGGSTNLCSNSYEDVKENISNLVKLFNAESGTKIEDCKSIFIGSAGIDTDEIMMTMEKLLREVGFVNRVKAGNDSELILASETKGKAGVCVISGTGSIAFAIDETGKSFRSGGWGYLIDDGGSGYKIGMEAVKHSLMQMDGRGENTILLDLIKDYFSLPDISDILNYIYSDDFNKAKIAEISLLVYQAGKQGDKVANNILESAADDLFLLVDALVKKANLSNHKVVLSGSVITKNTIIKDYFTRKVLEKHKDLMIVEVAEKPEMGAVYLAMNI